MTIDEAIEQYKHIADSYKGIGNTEDAIETRQIAEWLRQARGADKAARWYMTKIRELENRSKALETLIGEKEAENAKLRELAKAAWGCVKRQVSCDDCRMVFCGCTLQSAMRELGIEVADDD